MKSFVKFYESEKISPVSQDISDTARHFRRRDALYRSLGFPPSFLRGRSIVEFGPGSGFNSLHTAQYAPARYLLVDGNRYGVERINALFAEHQLPAQPEVVHSLFEEFESDERFDLVLCEGTLPFQAEPQKLLSKIAEHTAPGGMLVITCVDSVSYLPECLRRFAGRFLARELDTTDRRVARLLPCLSPHLDTLEAMSRPHEDWILDNIIQPFAGRWLLGISDAIDTLGGEFSVHGSSPRFLTDWRWYKEVVGDPRTEFNRGALEQYWENLHNFLDYRAQPSTGDSVRNRELKTLADRAYEACLATEREGADWSHWITELRELLGNIILNLAPYDLTAEPALRDFAFVLDQCAAGASDIEWGKFHSLFGRGQQYLSLLRQC